jgi:hypothetical protein
MSKFRNTFKTYNILNINNNNILPEYLENYIEYIININKDVILLLINSS